MKALILAAGRGDRLGAYTRDRPKAMVRVAGKPLIDHVLKFLNHAEIEEIGIVGGYKFEILRQHIEALVRTKKRKIRLFYNPDFNEGSVRTIMTAASFLDKEFILLNADHIYPKKMFRPYFGQMKGMTVACDFDRPLVQDDMKVKKDDEGFLKKIQKTLRVFDCGYIGSTFVPADKVEDYRRSLKETYEIYGKNSNAEAVVGHMAANGHKIKIADLSGIGWHEVDTPEDLKKAEAQLLKIRTMAKRYVRYIFAAAGVATFAALIYKLGIHNILGQLAKVGWWIVPTLSLSFVWYCCYTYAWYLFLKPLSNKLSFWELFKVKIMGEAINTMTPLNFVAGDPARAYILRHKFQMTEVAASVVVDRTLHSVSTVIMVLIGVAAALLKLKFLPYNIKYGLPIVSAIAMIFMGYILIHQHKGLFTFLASLAQRLRIKRSFSMNTLRKLEEVDGHIQDFYKRNRKGFVLALLLHLLGRFLGIMEVYIVGKVVNHAFTFNVALLLGAVAPIINFLFAFIPGSIGVLESAYSAILYFLRFSASIGITIQIIKRIRSLIWIGLGFVFIGVHDRKKFLQN